MCNLECAGCDTKWNSWTETDIHNVATTINRFKAKHVVITGGEPTLWQNELASMIQRGLSVHKTITVETNGAVPITNDYLRRRVDLWSFSPKVGSLGHDEVFS
jgi:organic radical activating enzyme